VAMAEDNIGSGERKYNPTPKRRQAFIDAGDIALSREFIQAIVLFSCFWITQQLFTDIANKLIGMMRYYFQSLAERKEIYIIPFVYYFTLTITYLFISVILVAFIAGIIQTRGHIFWNRVGFNWGNFKLLDNFNRFFSLFSLIKTISLNSLKCSVMIIGIYPIFYEALVLNESVFSLKGIIIYASTYIPKIIWRGLEILFLLGGIDYAYRIYQLEERMKMTSEEVKEEMKEQSGDTLFKRKRIRKMRELIKSNKSKQLADSDVVVVNPTHYAVALLYREQEMPAPKVTAKGHGFLAERLRKMARSYNIPIVSQPTLARALYYKVAVDSFIPKKLYRATALVLAYVYNLKKSKT
jgi:flagellar biosynthetic protein FlhB